MTTVCSVFSRQKNLFSATLIKKTAEINFFGCLLVPIAVIGSHDQCIKSVKNG